MWNEGDIYILRIIGVVVKVVSLTLTSVVISTMSTVLHSVSSICLLVCFYHAQCLPEDLILFIISNTSLTSPQSFFGFVSAAA
jgi:hypothetical protein